jgi:DNA-binding beta-propeller fold protein YncE
MQNVRLQRHALYLSICIVLVFGSGCKGQKQFGTEYMLLDKVIAMPAVKGRIDHIDADPKTGIAYIAALGNNSLEIINVQNGKLIHSIKGLNEPQGVAFIPANNEIFVANGGDGKCYFYNANNFQKTATVSLDSDADDVRYDSASQAIYVGYGRGGIAVIDVVTHRQIGSSRLPGHPESFQLDNHTNKIFVNVPDAGTIAVINKTTLEMMNSWRRSNLTANFPMALNLSKEQVFIGYRSPATLEVNSEDGSTVEALPMVSDADDIYYDAAKRRVYVSGGGGYVNIFQETSEDGYHMIANIPTRRGARTSFFVQQLQLLIVAARAEGGNEAELLVYKML